MTDQLTEEQIVGLKEAFSLYDQEKNGTISTKDLGNVMRSLGQQYSEADLVDLINEVDVEGKGLIHFSEFLMMMAGRCFAAWDDEEEMLEALQAFDKEETGFISGSDLKIFLRNLNVNLSEEELEEWLADWGTGNLNQVDYREFVKLMMSK